MNLLILLDFDGVLFNSAYEAFRVCEVTVSGNSEYRQGVSFEEFMECRRHLTDAWQFNRLYSKKQLLRDYSVLSGISPEEGDLRFAQSFFQARKDLSANSDWPKLMSPYNFFFEVKQLLIKYPHYFRILSTRNEDSITKTLAFNSVHELEIFGQEQIQKYGSKLAVAELQGWLKDNFYTVYVDDMISHLEPFEQQADLCFHAGWGYDDTHHESLTEAQMYKVIKGLVSIADQTKA